jgi:hypothetical protein
MFSALHPERDTPMYLSVSFPQRRFLGLLGAPMIVAVGISCDTTSKDDDFLNPPVWQSEQDLRVGSIDDPDYSLTWFRSLVVGEDGRIYTAHGQEQIVRVFEPDGTLLEVLGGRGDGPGEFQNLGPIGWVGDTLWALDYSLYRFNLFSPDGEFHYSFAVPFGFREDETQPHPPRAAGLLHDGTVHGAPPAFSHEVEDGTITHRQLLLMTRGGEVTDSVASIPFGNNTWAVYDPDDRMSGMMFSPQPYGDGPLWEFSPLEGTLTVVYREAPSAAEGARFTLIKRTLSGDTLFAREYSYQPDPLPQEEIDSVLGFNVARWEEAGIMRGTTAARLREWAERRIYAPPFRPPVSQLVLGRDGSYWLRGNPVERDLVPWFVLDSKGSPVGQVTLPAGVRVMAADRSAVWGTETDELDVSYLVRYRISPG